MCLVSQPRPTLCDPMDCSPPGSSVHGILWAETLDRVAMPSSRGYICMSVYEYIHIYVMESLCCTLETNTTL